MLYKTRAKINNAPTTIKYAFIYYRNQLSAECKKNNEKYFLTPQSNI